MNSFIDDILEQAQLATLNDDLLLQRLCEEVIFWQEYSHQNRNKELPADDRIHSALDFALQRLETYINSDGKVVDLRHLRHIRLPKIG
jgi:hypothetical protein